ncbi:MAG: hypothetical protein DLM72_17865 [Candidatus Nitrosopolaris wilkensis]|nr:MAG: hypothetical protein DLM72_17865 [Candidatus Nitrosopolaris wilkensis]
MRALPELICTILKWDSVMRNCVPIITNDGDSGNHSAGTTDTRKVINKTFDEAKNTARKAIEETHRDLPRYMQTVTDNQEQTVTAAKDTIENYLESQREITNSFQTTWNSFFDNYFWMSPKRITETYARVISSFSDETIAAIRIWNNIMLTNTGTIKMSMQHIRDNTREISRIAVNAAKMLEQTTSTPETSSRASIDKK